MISDLVLDDPDAIVALDSGELLRATATSGAQIRRALNTISGDCLDRVARGGPCRAVVVCGTGGSGVCGDLLAALAAVGSSVPVVAIHGPSVPAWVGPLDVFVAISTSGQTAETLLATDEAGRRGCRVVGIGGADSALEGRVVGGRGQYFAAEDAHRLARVSLWSLLTPLLLVADGIGVMRTSRTALLGIADRLDELAVTYGPISETINNRAKLLALATADCLPIVLGTSPLTTAIAYRFSSQLGANAKVMASCGALPEATTIQVPLLDGPLAAAPDLFRDPFEDPPGAPRLGLVVLRDGGEHPMLAAQVRALDYVAQGRDIALHLVASEASDPITTMAELLAVVDFASLYAAFALGLDPWVSPAIHEMKARVAQAGFA